MSARYEKRRLMSPVEARKRNKHYVAARKRWRRRHPNMAVAAPRELTVDELRRRGVDG